MKKQIVTAKAPAAIGPYSQAIKAGPYVFVSGQLPLDMATGNIPAAIEEQAAASLRNVGSILEAEGYSRGDVIKTTIFLKDMNDFVKVNEVYAKFFEGTVFPARSTVEVARPPKDARIEIEAVAYKE